MHHQTVRPGASFSAKLSAMKTWWPDKTGFVSYEHVYATYTCRRA
ncbi:MAG: hypothetical protein OES57_15095 [Acidimicrobiia bacterium]|nr:hypothetical protein [Acidimicrobiia bacterium]